MEGNFDEVANRFAEGIDILFSMARRLHMSNLQMKAFSFHSFPRRTQLKTLSMRNVHIDQAIDNDDRIKVDLPPEVEFQGHQSGYFDHFNFSGVTKLVLLCSQIEQNLEKCVFRLGPKTALQELTLYPRSSEVGAVM